MPKEPLSSEGGPAFPFSMPADATTMFGMSMRDWFAGQALNGMLSNNQDAGAVWMSYAADAYAAADAMLIVRDRSRNSNT